MKVFDVFDPGKQTVKPRESSAPKDGKLTSAVNKNQISRERREASKLSPSEAEAKIRSHFAKDKDVATISPKAAQMKKEKVVVVGDELPKPESSAEDTAKLGDFTNDPESPVIREKLKGALKSGAVSFSEKERAALEDILK
ncbi:MAG: hypothetical protein U0T83_04725 [Bacteriovoracaceae bacterium]